MRSRLLTASLLLTAATAAGGQTLGITSLIGCRVGDGFAAAVGSDPAAATLDHEVEDAASYGAHLWFRVAEAARSRFCTGYTRRTLLRT